MRRGEGATDGEDTAAQADVGGETGHGVGWGAHRERGRGTEVDIRRDAKDARVDEPGRAVVGVVGLLVVGRVCAADVQNAVAGLDQVGSCRTRGLKVGVELDRPLGGVHGEAAVAEGGVRIQVEGAGGAEVVGVDESQISPALKRHHRVAGDREGSEAVGDHPVGSIGSDQRVDRGGAVDRPQGKNAGAEGTADEVERVGRTGVERVRANDGAGVFEEGRARVGVG